MAAEMGLHRVASADLKRLVQALYRGHLESPISRRGLMLAKFGDLEGHLNSLVGLERPAALALLAALLTERGAHQSTPAATGRLVARPQTATSLLWRGPPVAGYGLTEPLAAVAERIATAERQVIWSGIPTATRSRLLRSLYAAQRGRDLSVTLFLNGPLNEAQEMVREVFVHGDDPPQCYGCPNPLTASPPCLIIDETQVLLFAGEQDLLDDDEATVVRAALAVESAELGQQLTQHLDHLRQVVPYPAIPH